MSPANHTDDERRALLDDDVELRRRKRLQYERRLSKTFINSDEEDEISVTSPVQHSPEGGWGWVIVVASFLSNMVLDGISYSFGMFLNPLVRDLHAKDVSVAMVGSIQAATYLSLGPVVARLVTKYGSRPVSISGAVIASLGIVGSSFSSGLPGLIAGYSLVAGVGFGLLYIPAVVSVAQYFTKRRGLATSICVCGTGVGTFILPPLVSIMLDHYGWRWAFRGLSILCLACVLCGITMAPVSSHSIVDITIENEEDDDETNREHVSDSCSKSVLSWILGPALAESPSLTTFFLVMAGHFFATVCQLIPYTYLPPLALSRGLNDEHAAFLISSAGISNTVGRLFAGWLCDKNWIHPITISMITTTLCTIPLLLMTRSDCTGFSEFLIHAGLFGLLTGVWLAAESPLLVTLLGVEQLASAFGLLICGGGVAALIGPPLAGVVMDLHGGRPMVALFLAAGAMALSALSYALALGIHKRKEKRSMDRSPNIQVNGILWDSSESQPNQTNTLHPKTTWICDRRQSSAGICLSYSNSYRLQGVDFSRSPM